MADGVASYAVERMSTALENKVRMYAGMRELAKKVKFEYLQMLACLEEADAREDPDQGFKAWREQLREIALAAQDIIVDFNIHFEHPPPHGIHDHLSKACRDICTLRDRRRVVNKLRKIMTDAVELSECRYRYTYNRGLVTADHG